MEEFAKRLRKQRKACGLTQAKLGKKTLISVHTICAYENGNRIPKADNVVILANFFKLSTDYLLGLSNRKEPQ